MENAACPFAPNRDIGQTDQNQRGNKPTHSAADHLHHNQDRENREHPIAGDKFHAALIECIFCQHQIDQARQRQQR
ncbi:Uncharacterised protein [Vibrio cholerae]|nr:Uncharacterised protein [Vibrio cholerae]CSA82751.1 Uncharacterised protein [Vibrio cholerae]CSB90657.1 Uncharacterised protein [Vibrio cholerae]CSC69921.1 Uncharacterised protein [Vibrio cholerae]